jgi:hypothetical protein
MKRGRPPKSLPIAGAIVDPDVETYRTNRTELDAQDETALRSIIDDDAFVAAVQNALRTAVVICDEADDPPPAKLRDLAKRVRVVAVTAAEARASGNPDAIREADSALADAIILAGAWSLAVCGMPPADGMRDPARLAKSAAAREARFATSPNPRGRLRDILDDELRAVFRSFGLPTTAWSRVPASPYARAFEIAARIATAAEQDSDRNPESAARDLNRRRDRRKRTA